ncbi:unnamed protein product [Dovyalis caffra]|uniref:Uncharacterized protein n=1 Tax=Dovyalis caffra TaxID=77055 RepID=A0AAV1RZH6_9ROSI|nr:unnamed protein product [Dovyalis caffra]
MGDQEGLWPRSVTSIALRMGAGLRSPQVGRAYVIICGRGAAQVAAPTQFNRAVCTERTILSPFTKEYRVLAANSGIRLFLEGSLSLEETPQL